MRLERITKCISLSDATVQLCIKVSWPSVEGIAYGEGGQEVLLEVLVSGRMQEGVDSSFGSVVFPREGRGG